MAYAIGHGKQVFVDWSLIEPGYGVAWGHRSEQGKRMPGPAEMPYGVRIAVHPPRIDSTPLVQADRPWESFINVYSTLFEDDGRYRLYYECHYHAEAGAEGDDLKGMLAYAESTDGVHWTKPELGLLRFAGSTQNNLVFGLDLALGRGAHGATVFKDPSAPAAQRYKLVHMGREKGVACVFGAVSPDGLRWSALAEPILTDYMSDTQTVVRYDEASGRYIGYFRGWAGDLHTRRTIAYATSEQFTQWPVPQTIVAPDAADSPDVDIYTNSYAPWPGGANAHLMFPAFYRRALDVPEVHLLTSRDGVRWQRTRREAVVGVGEPGSQWEGGFYAGAGLLCLDDSRWLLPVGPKWHTHNQLHYAAARTEPPPDRGHLRGAVWRRDGFTSLEAEIQGACSTIPLICPGGRLELNSWSRFGGSVRVELAQPSGEPLPGRTFADCDPISGDSPRRTVTWQAEASLDAWRDQALRLRFQLIRARLHALQFVPS